MYSPYNPCCTGSTADCPSQQPVPRTSGGLGGFLDIAGGWQQFVPAIEPAVAPQLNTEDCSAVGCPMFSGENVCCEGAYFGVACTAACANAPQRRAEYLQAISWLAYSKAWPEAMAGMREVFIGGSSLGRRELVDDPMPRHDHNWLTGEPAASQAEHDAWWERQQPKLDWGGA